MYIPNIEKKMSGMPVTPFSMPDIPILGILDGNKPPFSMPDIPILGIPDGNIPPFSMP